MNFDLVSCYLNDKKLEFEKILKIKTSLSFFNDARIDGDVIYIDSISSSNYKIWLNEFLKMILFEKEIYYLETVPDNFNNDDKLDIIHKFGSNLTGNRIYFDKLVFPKGKTLYPRKFLFEVFRNSFYDVSVSNEDIKNLKKVLNDFSSTQLFFVKLFSSYYGKNLVISKPNIKIIDYFVLQNCFYPEFERKYLAFLMKKIMPVKDENKDYRIHFLTILKMYNLLNNLKTFFILAFIDFYKYNFEKFKNLDMFNKKDFLYYLECILDSFDVEENEQEKIMKELNEYYDFLEQGSKKYVPINHEIIEFSPSFSYDIFFKNFPKKDDIPKPHKVFMEKPESDFLYYEGYDKKLLREIYIENLIKRNYDGFVPERKVTEKFSSFKYSLANFITKYEYRPKRLSVENVEFFHTKYKFSLPFLYTELFNYFIKENGGTNEKNIETFGNLILKEKRNLTYDQENENLIVDYFMDKNPFVYDYMNFHSEKSITYGSLVKLFFVYNYKDLEDIRRYYRTTKNFLWKDEYKTEKENKEKSEWFIHEYLKNINIEIKINQHFYDFYKKLRGNDFFEASVSNGQEDREYRDFHSFLFDLNIENKNFSNGRLNIFEDEEMDSKISIKFYVENFFEYFLFYAGYTTGAKSEIENIYSAQIKPEFFDGLELTARDIIFLSGTGKGRK